MFAGVEARESAQAVVAADSLAGLESQDLVRVAADIGHRAAQVAGRGDAEAGDAGGEIGAVEILGDQRAADGEAVIIVIGAVAERHAVERIAEMRGAEAAHLEGQRLLVEAQRVDRLRHHARQEVQRLLHAAAGRQHVEVRRQQGGDRARLAAADNDDIGRCPAVRRSGRRIRRLHRWSILRLRLCGTCQTGDSRHRENGLLQHGGPFLLQGAARTCVRGARYCQERAYSTR